MKFLSFSFNNYKGIGKEVNVSLDDLSCLVGNNESGKTTILKAIELIGKLCKGYVLKNGERNDARPKSHSFTGSIVLGVEFVLNDEEASSSQLKTFKEDLGNSKNKIKLVFKYTFSNSQFESESTEVFFGPTKIAEAKKNKITDFVKENAPEIIYYDDFKFDVPEKIRFLKTSSISFENNKNDELLIREQNKAWQSIFDDLLNGAIDFKDGERHTFQDEIIDWDTKKNEGDTETVSQRLVSVNNHLNKVVNNQWKDVTGGHSIFEKFYMESDLSSTVEGFVDYTVRAKTKNSTFKIPERSKGCRWFFCFKVFTEIRSNRNNKGTVFLLDEPASNLHIHPQEKILDSLLELSKKDRVNILYSTHSPFLIDTQNLNNIFIVENQSGDSDGDAKISLCKLENYSPSDDENSPSDDEKGHTSLQPIINNIALNILNNDENGKRRKPKDVVAFMAKTFPDHIVTLNNGWEFFEKIFKHIVP